MHEILSMAIQVKYYEKAFGQQAQAGPRWQLSHFSTLLIQILRRQRNCYFLLGFNKKEFGISEFVFCKDLSFAQWCKSPFYLHKEQKDLHILFYLEIVWFQRDKKCAILP